MATANNTYAIKWNDHANNFPISLSDLLKQKDLIDVTLVADGYLFDAHRLILSTISPYFRQMFTQMPANQQAFVFMKDVSKDVLEDLITFIYRGEVSVKQNNLKTFFQTAKALEINGLADRSPSQAFEHQSVASNVSSSAYSFNGLQYQSTRIVPFQGQIDEKIQPDVVHSSHFRQQTKEFQQQSPSILGSSFDSTEFNASGQPIDNNDNGYNVNVDYYMRNNETLIDQHAQDIQWNNSDENEQLETPTIAMLAPKAKRMKRTNAHTTGFDIVADVRKNQNGGENLYRNGFKFSKHGKGLTKQHWQCTKTKSVFNCRASASTMDIDGVIMMKELMSEHTHPSI